MTVKKASLCALAAAVCLAANAAGNLLPASFVSDLCQKQGTGVTYLAADGDMPEGILVTTDKALDPVTFDIPRGADEGSCFYRIVME